MVLARATRGPCLLFLALELLDGSLLGSSLFFLLLQESAVLSLDVEQVTHVVVQLLLRLLRLLERLQFASLATRHLPVRYLTAAHALCDRWGVQISPRCLFCCAYYLIA